jgi:hypothetical protein
MAVIRSVSVPLLVESREHFHRLCHKRRVQRADLGFSA